MRPDRWWQYAVSFLFLQVCYVVDRHTTPTVLSDSCFSDQEAHCHPSATPKHCNFGKVPEPRGGRELGRAEGGGEGVCRGGGGAQGAWHLLVMLGTLILLEREGEAAAASAASRGWANEAERE